MRPVLTDRDKRNILSEYRKKTIELANTLLRKKKFLGVMLERNNSSPAEKNEFERVYQEAYAKFSVEIKKIENNNFFNNLLDDAYVEAVFSTVFAECENLASEVISICNRQRDVILKSDSSGTTPPVATAAVPQNTSTVSMGLFSGNSVVVSSKVSEGLGSGDRVTRLKPQEQTRKTVVPAAPSYRRSPTPAPQQRFRGATPATPAPEEETTFFSAEPSIGNR